MGYLDRIKEYFQEKLGEKFSSVKIVKVFNKPCYHCGYGEIITGNVTTENDNDTEFIYKTGCMTYSEEMIYDGDDNL